MADVLSSESIAELLGELIRIPSVNPSIASSGTGEAEIARFCQQWLAGAGVHAWIDELSPRRANVVAEVGRGGGPTLVLCAHLDTVGVEGMTIPPFASTLHDGRVFGRGSYDMKGSVAAIMAAAASLARTPLGGRILLALVADEEYASDGAFDFVRRYPADACVVTEPSEGKLVLAHKGFVWATVRTSGRAAHGSRWDLGVSAIGRMASVIAALEEFDRTELRLRVHPLVGPASLHCALVEGGVGLSTYAPACELKVERRTLPGETIDTVRGELEAVVRTAGVEAEVDCFFDRAPLACDGNAPIVSCVRDAVRTVTGEAPEETGVGFWMDAAVFAAAGVPTVNYGPAGAGAHESVEWVDLASVVRCARVLKEAAQQFSAAPRTS